MVTALRFMQCHDSVLHAPDEMFVFDRRMGKDDEGIRELLGPMDPGGTGKDRCKCCNGMMVTIARLKPQRLMP